MEASVRAQVSFCPLFVTGRQVGGLASNLGVQSLNNLVVARAGLAPSPQVQTGVHRCAPLTRSMAKNPPENHRHMVNVFGMFGFFQPADRNLLLMAR